MNRVGENCIPEIVLLNAFKIALNYLRRDSLKTEQQDSFLRSFFSKDMLNSMIKIDKFNFYEQSVEIFKRDETNQRKIEVVLGFNLQRQNAPTIHITFPSEQNSQDGIGMDEGYVDFDTSFNRSESTFEEGDSYERNYTRTFVTTYNAIITSDNSTEVICIYHALRALMIQMYIYFEFAGIRNLKISGGDLALNPDLVPMNLFTRAISFNFMYEVVVPDFVSDEVLNFVEINNFKRQWK